MIYEILNANDEVINTIVADAEFMSANFPENNYREVVESPIETTLRHISVGSFFDRFGAFKWAILADTNPLVQALVKDASVRKYIDLNDPQLRIGLEMLVQAGHNIDVNKIIEDEILGKEIA